MKKSSRSTKVYKTEMEILNPVSQKQAAICNLVSTLAGFGWLVVFSAGA